MINLNAADLVVRLESRKRNRGVILCVFNPFEIGELLNLLAGKKQDEEPAELRRKKLFFGGFFFGLVGAGLGAKLASKGDLEPHLEYSLMLVAALFGYFLFFKIWRTVLG